MTLRVSPPAHPETTLGCLLEASWGLLGASWSFMAASWGPLGGLLGASWGPPVAILGASWGLLGASWGHLGGDRSKKGVEPISPPPQEPLKSPLGALLGRSWSALGAVLGLSWAPLGALLGPLGAILRPRMPIGSEKAIMQKSLIFLGFLKVFGLLEGSLGSSVASWSRLGTALGPLGPSSEPS